MSYQSELIKRKWARELFANYPLNEYSISSLAKLYDYSESTTNHHGAAQAIVFLKEHCGMGQSEAITLIPLTFCQSNAYEVLYKKAESLGITRESHKHTLAKEFCSRLQGDGVADATGFFRRIAELKS